MSYPINLVGDQVALREFAPGDVDDVLAIIGDDQVTTWLSFDSRSRAEAIAMVDGAVARAQEEPRTEYYLAVTPKGEDRVVGFARIAFAGARAGKLGYAIAAHEWGRGYATDAARRLTTYAFAELGLHRVSAAIGPSNQASIAVVGRLGFQMEGILRDHVYTNGGWQDSVLYSVLENEWPLSSKGDRR